MPGWKNVGSGFSGIPKFQRLLNDQEDYRNTENSMEIRVHSTPEKKTKCRRIAKWSQMASRGSSNWQQNTLFVELNASNTNAKASEQFDGITWSDSSAENDTEIGQSEEQGFSRKRKMPQSSCQVEQKQQRNPPRPLPSLVEEESLHINVENSASKLHIPYKKNNFPPAKLPNKLAPIDDIDIVSQSSTNSDVSGSRTFSQESKPHHEFVINPRVSRNDNSDNVICKSKLATHSRLHKAHTKSPHRKVARQLYKSCPNNTDGNISDIESDAASVSDDGENVANDDVNKAQSVTLDGEEGQSCSQSQSINQESSPASLDQSLKCETGGGFEVGSQTLSDVSCMVSSPPSSPSRHGIKASDWANAAYQTTHSSAKQSTDDTQIDSAKKKSKFKRGSLSGQLSRLIKREKSAVRFWYHSLKAGGVDLNNPKAITVELVHLKREFSVHVCLSKVYESEKQSTEVCKVLFLNETVEKFNLKRGSVVQVFPPWQQLEEPSGMRTLLCTQYVRVLSQPDTAAAPERKPKEDIGATVYASWKCPCVSGTMRPPAKCPAAVNRTVSVRNPLYGKSDLPGHVTETDPGVTRLSSIRSGPAQCDALDSLVDQTFLEGLEKVGTDSSQVPPFSAAVLRVFEKYESTLAFKRYDVLLEDDAGTLVLIKDVTERLSQSGVPLTQLEDRLCSCQGLSVANRTNKDRDPALFNVIAQVWKRRFSSIGGQNSEMYSKHPRFCYVLTCVSGGSLGLTVLTDTGHRDSEDCSARTRDRPLNPALTDKEVFQAGVNSRVSFLAKVLFISNSLQEQEDSASALYVLLQCAHNPDVVTSHRIKVSDGCGGVLELMGLTAPETFFFRDVLIAQESLQCDCYTLAVKRPSWKAWCLTTRIPEHLQEAVVTQPVKLAPVDGDTQLGCLTSVHGSISGVDESSSCSWEQCNTCNSDQLVEQHRGYSLWCMSCQRPVLCPVVKMKMSVFIATSHTAQPEVIQVHLTEKTIKALLPPDPGQEGYDVEQVRGREVSLPFCIVQENRTSQDASKPKDCAETDRMILLTELDWG